MTNIDKDQTMGELGAKQAGGTFMLLDSLEQSNQTAAKVMRRGGYEAMYWDVCMEASVEQAARGECEKRLWASEWTDKHFSANFEKAWKGTRGAKRIENFFRSAVQVEAPSTAREEETIRSLHIRALTNADEAEKTKVVGWFNQRESIRGESGCRVMWSEAEEAGLDTSRWLSMMWTNSHGVASGMRRLEIMCTTREEAIKTLGEMRAKLGQKLDMSFYSGRTLEHRKRAREAAASRAEANDTVRSSQNVRVRPADIDPEAFRPVPAKRITRRYVTQAANPVTVAENPFCCLMSRQEMDDIVFEEASSGNLRIDGEREQSAQPVLASAARDPRTISDEEESMAGEGTMLDQPTDELQGEDLAQSPTLSPPPHEIVQNAADIIDDVATNNRRVMRRAGLVVATWNANGLQSRSVCELVEKLRTIDILGVTETQCGEHTMMRIPGFHHIGDAMNTVRMKGKREEHMSRGISVYYKASSQLCIDRVANVDGPDVVYIRIRPRRGQPIILGCYYALQAGNPKSKGAYKRLNEQIGGFIEQGHRIILMGDFNAKTGLGQKRNDDEWHNHDLISNANGERLVDIANDNGLEFLDLPKGTPPYTRVVSNSQSVIDYILTSPQLKMHDGGRRYPTFNAGSDHIAVVAMIKIQVQLEAEGGKAQERPNFEKLRDGPENGEEEDSRRAVADLRNRFADKVQEKLSEINWVERCNQMEFPGQVDVNKMFDEWAEAIRSAGTEVLGVKRVGGKKRVRNYGWWTPRLSNISQERQKMFKKLVERGSVRVSDWERYVEKREEVKKEVEAAKRGGWEQLMHQIVDARKKPSKKQMWGLIMRTVKKPLTQADPTQVIGDDGRLTASVDEALKQWRSHFEKVANPIAGNFDEAFKVQVDEETEARREAMHVCPPLQVSADECEAAIKEIPVGASPGANGISNAALKYGGGHRFTPMERPPGEEEKEQSTQRLNAFAEGIAALCNLVGRAEVIPAAWDEARQVPIPKSSAAEDPTNRDNFRGVTLRDSTSKLASKIFIKKYFEDKYEKMICQEQGGFRRSRRCAHQLFALVDTVQRANVCKEMLYILFVDFRKAYPSVWRNGMFKKLSEGVGPNMEAFVLMMEKFANGGCTRIFLQGKESEPYTASVGVQEGATESPKLFNVHINDLPQALRDSGANGVQFAGQFIAALFADDLAIAAESVDGLQVCLDALAEYCKMWRMTVSMSKTKVMRCGAALGRPAHVTFNGEVVGLVDNYKYLGVWVQSNGRWDKEFRERMKSVAEAQRSVSPFLADRNVPIRLRAQAWTALVRSRIEYGCDIVVYNMKQREAWERVQKTAAARILGCNRHTSSDAMRGDLGWHTLAVRADRYRVRLLHEITQTNLLPMATMLWRLEAGVNGGYGRWPKHTMRKELRRLDDDHDKIFGVVAATHPKFQQASHAGWKWARVVIEERAVAQWKTRLQEKIDACEEKGSTSQVKMYMDVKLGWGKPTYSQLTGKWVRVVSRIRLGTLPVEAFQSKMKQGGGGKCPQCQVEGVEAEETIEHFAWECKSGANNVRRNKARMGVKNIICSCAEVKAKYAAELASNTDDDWEQVFRTLVLGTGVEEGYPEAFPENPAMVGGRSYGERRGLNQVNGRIAGISKTLFEEMWEERNRRMTDITEGVQDQRAPEPPVPASQEEDFIPLPGDIEHSISEASVGRNRSVAARTTTGGGRRSAATQSVHTRNLQRGIQHYFGRINADSENDRGHSVNAQFF